MDYITLTSTEVAYIIHILSKHYFEDEDIAHIIRLLIMHMPLEHE